MFVWMYTLNRSNQVHMITVKVELFSRQEWQWAEDSFRDFYIYIQQYKNNESKWTRNRSTFELVSYWPRWIIIQKRRWECQGIYEPEVELYIILAIVLEARVKFIFHRRRQKCTNLVPNIEDPRWRLISKRIIKMEEWRSFITKLLDMNILVR